MAGCEEKMEAEDDADAKTRKEEGHQQQEKRGRGRPKGSLNKKKLDCTGTGRGRGRGRGRGSNKRVTRGRPPKESSNNSFDSEDESGGGGGEIHRDVADGEEEDSRDPLEEDLSGTCESSESSQMGFPPSSEKTPVVIPILPIKKQLSRLHLQEEASSTTPSSSTSSSRTSSPSRGGRGRGRSRGRPRLTREEKPRQEEGMPNGITGRVREMILGDRKVGDNSSNVDVGISCELKDEICEQHVSPPSATLHSEQHSDQEQSSDEPLVPILHHSSSSSSSPSAFSVPRQRQRREATKRYGGFDLSREAKIKISPLKLDKAQLERMRGRQRSSSSSSSSSGRSVTPVRKEVDLTIDEETKKEIKERMGQFIHITENTFMCERKINKQSRGMECDCTISREDVDSGRKGCGDDCLNRLLMIECGKKCSLGKHCGNKKFQNVENAPVEVFKTKWKGFGLRALKDIPADEFIMEYVGDVLDPKQFRKRARQFAREDARHFYFMALSTEYCIDASHRGNISRFINHSCEPNAETQKWTVNGELRIGFFSKRVIRRGEEITFDYKYERYGQEAQKCYCGSDNCRGWLGGEPGGSKDEDEEEDDDEEAEEDEWSTSTSEEEGEEEETSLKPIARTMGAAVTKRATSSSRAEPSSPVRPLEKSTDSAEMATPPREDRRLKRRRRRRLKRGSPRKIKNYEEDEYEEEVEILKMTGVRTKRHTVDLCRLMVRSTDFSTRMALAGLLHGADQPCKRLFLDYHGLKILHGWMETLGWTQPDLELKAAVEDALDSLSVPHKTMLKESKVLQAITVWAEASCEEEAKKLRASMTSRPPSPKQAGGSAGNSRVNTPPQTPTAELTTPQDSTSRTSTPTAERKGNGSSVKKNLMYELVLEKMKSQRAVPELARPKENEERAETQQPSPFEVPLEEDAPPPGEEDMDVSFVSDREIEVGSDPVAFIAEESIKMEVQEVDASETADNEVSKDIPTEEKPDVRQETDEEMFAAVEETVRKIVDEISSQDVDDSSEALQTREKLDEKSSAEVAPVAKAEVTLRKKADEDEEVQKKVRVVREKAAELLEAWSTLQEVFKIPKKELVKLRAEHEREVDRAAAARLSQSLRGDAYGVADKDALKERLVLPPPPPPPPTRASFSSSRRADGGGGGDTEQFFFPRQQQQHPRERRISRFDDQTGLLHRPTTLGRELSREHRRQLFAAKAEVEEMERKRRRLLQQQHENKCYYLGMDAAITPMFEQYPEFYLDPNTGEWMPMPEKYPLVDVSWGYAGMASLPLRAFNPETDPPMSPYLDPAFFYPPGVVPVSYIYGVPLGEKADEIVSSMYPEVTEDPDNPHRRERLQQPPPPPTALPFLSSDPAGEIPFLGESADGPVTTQPDYEPGAPSNSSGDPTTEVPDVTSIAGGTANGYGGSSGNGNNPRPQIVVRLPPRWRCAKDAQGRVYYYNTQTKEAQWDPPSGDGDEDAEDAEADVLECETASLVAESPRDGNGGSNGEDDEESDDEDDEDGEEEEGEDAVKRRVEIEILSSDLSAQEKELLLARRKRTKSERRAERKQKRERDREKREYERRKRRERHGKHKKSGLVTEHLIPKRTDKDKLDLMTFKEIRERLANRDAIRERQDLEERAEAERELLLEKAKRAEERAAAKVEQQPQDAVAEAAPPVPAVAAAALAPESMDTTTTAAADTSSEVAKKVKERFKKDTSKVIVRVLDPYRRPDAARGRIKSNEDFKHLAKKLTNYIMSKELKHCSRIEDLRCSESVKKKTTEYVRKYMLKFGDYYKPSPQA